MILDGISINPERQHEPFQDKFDVPVKETHKVTKAIRRVAIVLLLLSKIHAHVNLQFWI